jgi:hypothetical protein
LLAGFAVGIASKVLFDSLGWLPNEARWPVVLICAINGAVLGAWGFQWVQVSNEHFDVDE